MSLPKPLQSVVDFHREQPVGAILAVAMAGVGATFASETMLMLAIDNDMRMPVPLIIASGVLFVLWWPLCIATLVSSLTISTSRVTLIAAVWYLESMIQLGVTANVSRSTIVVVLVMSAFALMSYVIAAYRLQAKIVGIRQERKMAPFVAVKATAKVDSAEDELMLPTRK